MRVVWAPEAEADRELIWEYIASDSLAAAARMDELFDAPRNGWRTFPNQVV